MTFVACVYFCQCMERLLSLPLIATNYIDIKNHVMDICILNLCVTRFIAVLVSCPCVAEGWLVSSSESLYFGFHDELKRVRFNRTVNRSNLWRAEVIQRIQ
jgi:hypothetical protein